MKPLSTLLLFQLWAKPRWQTYQHQVIWPTCFYYQQRIDFPSPLICIFMLSQELIKIKLFFLAISLKSFRYKWAIPIDFKTCQVKRFCLPPSLLFLECKVCHHPYFILLSIQYVTGLFTEHFNLFCILLTILLLHTDE